MYIRIHTHMICIHAHKGACNEAKLRHVISGAPTLFRGTHLSRLRCAAPASVLHLVHFFLPTPRMQKKQRVLSRNATTCFVYLSFCLFFCPLPPRLAPCVCFLHRSPRNILGSSRSLFRGTHLSQLGCAAPARVLDVVHIRRV